MKNNNPFPSWPFFSNEERQAVDSVLASGKVNYWTGEEARKFEQEYAAAVGVRHAIALTSGTVALELPLRMWGIGPGDEVVVTPRSFIASVSCAVLLGAVPVFADVDRDSGNLTAESIERVITPRTRAIILVHLGGWPCEMDAILALAKSRGIKVIEDCAQSHGASYRGRQLGSMGDAAAFSFCQDKIITTGGEGGMLMTNDSELWSRAWSFKDHGKSYQAIYERSHPPGFRSVHESFGTNCRITELQAAIGRVQLRALPRWTEQRRTNAKVFYDSLDSMPGIRAPQPPDHMRHAYYRCYVYVDTARLGAGWTRDRIIQQLNSRGVPCFSGSCPEIYNEKAFDSGRSRPHEPLPVAHELGESSLAFLVHPTLTADHMLRMADEFRAVLCSAVR